MTSTISFSRSDDFPWREGNHFEILVDAPRFLPEMISSIESAQHYVLLEMYLIESGKMAEHFIEALCAAALRGVQVYLLLDDFGAIGLKQATRKRLQRPNIHITYYNALRSHSTIYNLYRIFIRHRAHGLHRNHRKLLLVDGRQSFVGGVGITDEFAPSKHPERRWRETMVSIRGPVVQDWQQLFENCWRTNTSEQISLFHTTHDAFDDGQPGRLTVSHGLHRNNIFLSLNKHIDSAKEYVWFATAYFVPPRRLLKALTRAAKRGVDVRLLVPGPITDHPGARYAGHHHYPRLLRNGVRIFEYQPRFFHAKTVLCDDWIAIGSSNFDRWNLHWNLEANQEIKDINIAHTVVATFNKDFFNSVEIDYQTWSQRSIYLRFQQWLWKKVELFSRKIGS